MKISGAIFDCDGTILDSMPMWNKIFPDWLNSHNIPHAHMLAEKYEYMNFQDECFFFHDEFGVCASREEALAEVCALVRVAYRTEAAPFEGIDLWLKTLQAAKIPMVVASSTTTSLVKEALAYHGLLDYFMDILYTGDVGVDKTQPDIYFAAREVLDTPLDETWVFEDAPFGVSTAYKAGFPTVCLFNDHDGRDENFMRANCDVFVHGYPELSLDLLTDYARSLTTAPTNTMNCLVIGGSPVPSSTDLVTRLAADADWIVAVDRGAETLKSAGIKPDAFCGDDDTASPATCDWARSVARTSLLYPTKKYATDLAIALKSATHEAARRNSNLRLTLSCISGGRQDHQLGVWGNLAAYVNACPHIVEDNEGSAWECRLLSPAGMTSWTLDAEAVGKTFSAVALAPNTLVSEEGLRWEVNHKSFALLSDVGISNEVISENACISCHQGILACFLLS